MRQKKILVVTTHYPSYHIGGYETACSDVVERLGKRGYDILVLTGNHGCQFSQRKGWENGVFRKLLLRRWGEKRGRWTVGWFEIKANLTLKRILAKFQPDLIYLWNMQLLAGSVLQTIQGQKKPVVFSLFGYWPFEETEYDIWLRDWRIRPWVKKLVGPLLPMAQEKPFIEHAHFCSQSVREYYKNKGVSPRHGEVIYPGVDTETFTPSPSQKRGHCFRLLYAGQVIPHKGILTALKALALLVHQRRLQDLTLTVVGPEVLPDFAFTLKNFVKEQRFGDHVCFKPQVPREQLISIYHNHDAFVFPPTYAEPFAVVALEAMACGMPLIGTPVGGQIEIFRDGVNCLTFPPEDAEALAERIVRLRQDPELCLRLGAEARKTVLERFGIERTVHQVERFLNAV